MTLVRNLLIAALATSLLPPATAFAESPVRKRPAKITVHPKRLWHGYGFLPGYRPQPNNYDLFKRSARRDVYEPRYWHNGQITYGWGYPGFYRGRWNGGSFGPCWASTPIGMMPTCGQ